MSGDVQPRKRKEKKKQKDDESNSPLNDDVNIHVHKEGGTGGNICAKIVFFFLFSALIVLVGLIIKENQGLTELDEIESSESRYSQIFEGWVDKSAGEHEDDHSPELSLEHDEHDLEGEEDDHYESEEDNVEETEEERSEEIDHDDEEDSATRSEEETNEESEEEDQVSESEEDNSEEVVEQSESQENFIDESEEVDENVSKDDVDEDEDTKEDDKSKEQSIEDNDDDDDDNGSKEEDKVAYKIKEGLKETVSGKNVSKEDKEEESKKAEAEEVILVEAPAVEEQAQVVEIEPEKPKSGMATKIGVGVALLVVAYNVFFRKRSAEKPFSRTLSEKEPTPDLSRRNTLVPPLTLEEVEPDLPDIEGEEEEYSEEEYSDEDSRSEHRSAREEYQELSSNYTRSLESNFKPNKSLEAEALEPEDDVEEEELEEEIEELDDEEIEDDYEKYDDDEDEELLKRLEAKYGKLGRDVNVGEEVESDSDKEGYEHSDITNKEDYEIKADIDAAQEHLKKNAAYANTMFEALLDKYPHSPRLLYGKAKSLDMLAEERQSNDLLQQALSYYMKALTAQNVPDQLFVMIAERYIDRARFMGQYKKAVAAHWQLIDRFPDNPTYLNNLAVTYLTINLIEEARSVLKKVLSKWSQDGFALVHYGFILKTTDNNLEESVEYLKKGLRTKDPGVVDGRFYFHLGDALTRLDKNDEAMKLYEEGVKEKVFMSKYQRSLYNVPRLTAKAWWEPADLPAYQKLFLALKDSWRDIRKEGISALNDQGYFRDEAENLKDTGTWKQLELFARGQKFAKNCAKSPITCNVIQSFADARNCRRGQTKFSVMHPGTHVWPHCGPTNCRLRMHLGLKVPPNTFIRVAEETRSWKEGDVIIFDDSFEHEVWHNGSDFRLVLIVDIWHPELTPTEKKSLSSI